MEWKIKSRESINNKLKEWHKYYAYLPTKISNEGDHYTYVWLCKLWRRGSLYEHMGTEIWTYQYKKRG